MRLSRSPSQAQRKMAARATARSDHRCSIGICGVSQERRFWDHVEGPTEATSGADVRGCRNNPTVGLRSQISRAASITSSAKKRNALPRLALPTTSGFHIPGWAFECWRVYGAVELGTGCIHEDSRLELKQLLWPAAMREPRTIAGRGFVPAAKSVRHIRILPVPPG